MTLSSENADPSSQMPLGAPPRSSHGETASVSGGADLSATKETILLVEDEEIVRRVAGRKLTRSGYRVLEAPSGEAALKIVAQHVGPIHLVVTDVVMPDMNGRQMADLLQERGLRAPVLYMSGYPENIIASRGILQPGIHFLEKTYLNDRLLDVVRSLLENPALPDEQRRPE
jgi:DNA-binding NtrC family response regulator